jgi:uncharacterized membrane protein YesL
MFSLVHIFRWCLGALLGFLVGFLSLSVLAALLYALPRAVVSAVKGLARWNVSRFYLVGALAYAVVVGLTLLIAHLLHADVGGLILGFIVASIGKLANLSELKADVDRRLGLRASTPSQLP